MTPSRLLLVVLIILGLVFALGIGLGASNNEKPPNKDNEKEMKRFVKDFTSKSWSKLLTDGLSPVFPKLLPAEIKKGASKALVGQKRFPTINKSSSLVLNIAPLAEDSWIPVRQAALVRKRGSVKVYFEFLLAENESLRMQCIPSKKDCDDAQPSQKWDEESLTIPQEGGTLTLTCGDDVPCRVELKES